MIYSLGEALVDLINGKENIGGAPCNVICTVCKMGEEGSFISKIGKDKYGDIIKDELIKLNVNIDNVIFTPDAQTGVCKITLNNGERSFEFETIKRADMLLSKNEVEHIQFKKDDILHHGSICLIDQPIRYATLQCIKSIKEQNGYISFDVNVRKNIWENEDEYRSTILEYMQYTDILKISDEDIEFIYNTKDYLSILNNISPNIKIVFLTLGSKGSYCYYKNNLYYTKAHKVDVVDTTGAGDIFTGIMLSFLHKKDLNNLDIKDLKNAIKFATYGAGLVCKHYGVVKSIPTKEKIQKEFNKK